MSPCQAMRKSTAHGVPDALVEKSRTFGDPRGPQFHVHSHRRSGNTGGDDVVVFDNRIVRSG